MTNFTPKKILIYIGLLAAIFFAGIILFIGILALRDPVTALPPPEMTLNGDATPLNAPPGRKVQHITLHSATLGDIGMVVSLPEPLPTGPRGKMPVVIVLGGLGTGENNIRYITNAGDNVIVGYDWPIPTRLPNGFGLVLALPALYRNALSVPGQMVSNLGWLRRQSWADTSRFSLLGFSLGALATPAIQDMAQRQNIKIGWTILAYGGAPLGSLFASDTHIKPAFLRVMLAPVIDLLLRPVEPQLHLPRLSGRFLVMEGENDSLMPENLRANLRAAVPQPKDVVVFPGEHMGVGAGQLELLQLIIATSRTWLAQTGAVNR